MKALRQESKKKEQKKLNNVYYKELTVNDFNARVPSIRSPLRSVTERNVYRGDSRFYLTAIILVTVLL